MESLYRETEHQELFYLDADLRRPVAVHIPSALGTLGYYVCLRVPAALAPRLQGITTALQIGGLRPDDLTLRQGDGLTRDPLIPSTVPGLVWVLLCRAHVSRGDGTVTFSGLPAEVTRADLLLCTWPRFLESGQADAWIACQADPHWAPNGVPLGGIGCGKVEISRDGRFRNFSGNNNQDMPLEEPDGLDGAFLSVACGRDERILATRPMAGLTPVPKLAAELAFPQACLAATEVFPGVDAAARLSGTTVPHDLTLASLPGFVVRWTVTNRGAEPVTVRCRLAWPNLVGAGGGIGKPEQRIGYGDGFYVYSPGPEAHAAASVAAPGVRALRYTNAPNPLCPNADGAHYIAARRRGGRVEVAADPRRGSVSVTLRIPAGATRAADMAVAWDMPRWVDQLGVDRGHFWQNHCADGLAVLRLLFRRCERILAEGAALRELLRATDLPTWQQERLVNCNYPLITNSVLYRDGRFSVNEGPTEMAGCYGTIDQRLGAHPATQLLFPGLNAQELNQFAAYQSPNGGINHDLGGGHLERGPSENNWPDLTCSFILQHARHAWSTGDRAFERAAWPRVRRALLRHAQWAEEGGGVAQVGHGLGTSYDGYHYEGTTPYMGTLWIAALQVCRAWAERAGDHDLPPRIDGWIEAARRRLEADLWNGEYYRAYASVTGPRNDNCHAGMLAGEYYARMLAGTDVLEPARLDACAEAWFKLNGSPRFAVPPDEARRDGSAGSEYGWLPYVECFGLAPLAVRGDARVAAVWERMVRHMQGGGRTPCDTRLMYRPVNGEPSWGAYYMTAPASWLVYDALLDFFYTPATGTLRLLPQREGRSAVVHPLFWGVVTRRGDTLTLEVRRVFTRKRLTLRCLETQGTASGVTLAGQALAPTGAARGLYRRFACAPVDLRPGAVVTWTTA